jgi:hypothetical protein
LVDRNLVYRHMAFEIFCQNNVCLTELSTL